MGRKGRPVWVDGKEYASLKAAAAAMDMKPSTLNKALVYGAFTLRGHRVADTPPRAAKTGLAPEKKRELLPLLRFKPGETPLDTGIRHWY